MALAIPRVFGPLTGPIPLGYLDSDFTALAQTFVASIAELRTVPKTGCGVAIALGYYAAGDGCVSVYRYNAADTTAENGFTTIVAADGGHWNLDYVGSLCDRQAGVKADAVSDDTAAHQNAINYVQNTYNPAVFTTNSPYAGTCSLFHGSGLSIVTSALTQTQKIAHTGDGPAERSSGTRIQQNTTNVDLFQITPIAQGMSVSFQNMALIGNGLGGTGNLIHVKVGAGGAACNSQRYEDLVWAQPGQAATYIEIGDDIMFRNCLVDIASADAHIFGTATPTSVASNVHFIGCRWFDVQTRVVLAVNISGMEFIAPSVYCSTSGGITSTQWFIDGVNGLPYQIKNVSIIGGQMTAVQILAQLQAAVAFKVIGGNYQSCGNGVSSTISFISLTGTCDQITLQGVNFQGHMGPMSFYDDSGATVTNLNMSGCTFDCAAGMTGVPIKVASSTGVIGLNFFPGWTGTPVVSQQFSTSGTAINPGLIAAGGTFTFTTTVTGAKIGDRVTATNVAATDVIPIGITTRAWISAAGTLSFKLINNTGAGITPAAFDFGFLVTRGC